LKLQELATLVLIMIPECCLQGSWLGTGKLQCFLSEWKNVFMLLFLYNFIFALRNLCVYVEIRSETSELILCCPPCKWK